MRISTGMVFQRGLEALQRQQSQMLNTQQHIAAGKRVLVPSDDPVAASRAVEVEQSKTLNAQYGANQKAARDKLALVESTLGHIGGLLQDIRTSLVNAGNGSLSDFDRRNLAQDMQAKLSQLVGLANSRDGGGAYLFGGYRDTVQPFTPTAAGASYNGDQGRQEVQVSAGRSIPVTENGIELFERIRQGNGVFVTDSDPDNTGASSISVGSVVGSVTVPLDDYRLEFHVTGGVTTYDVINTTTSTTLSTGNAYVSGGAILFNGMQVEVQGTPADLDAFEITQSQNQSVFSMVSEAITAMTAPAASASDRARYTQTIDRSLANMDRALDNALTVRTSMGASLRELDSLNELVQDNALFYEQRLSDLVDLDYATAISDFTRQQNALEAAQLSYQRITSLSLFNYL